jgi:hypothetical protein
VVAVAVVPSQLVIPRVQEKLVVRVVEPLETMEVMEVPLLDWELRVKVLTAAYLPYWLRGRAVVVVDQQVSVQLQLTTRPPPEKVEAEHSIRFLELLFAMQPVVVQEHRLAMWLVQRVIAAAPLHRMVVPEHLVQSHPLHQLRILALVAEAQVGQQVLIWSAETALAELLLFNTTLTQLPQLLLLLRFRQQRTLQHLQPQQLFVYLNLRR